jgi:hypothetical protein
MIWRYLPITDFLNVIQVNKLMYSIGIRNDTWRFLLQRDFDIEATSENKTVTNRPDESNCSRKEYIKLYNRQKIINYKSFIVHTYTWWYGECIDHYITILAKDYEEAIEKLIQNYHKGKLPYHTEANINRRLKDDKITSLEELLHNYINIYESEEIIL